MSQVNLTEMVDILPAIAMPIEPSHYYFYGILMSVLVFSLLLFFVLRYTHQPLKQLKRQLLTQQISTREAAHRLNKIVQSQSHVNKQSLEQQLKQIRFQRQTPDSTILLSIIDQYQHGQ
jgi:hypothetical protein